MSDEKRRTLFLITHHSSLITHSITAAARRRTPGGRSLDGGGVFGLEQAAPLGRVGGAAALGGDEERVVVRLEPGDADVDLRAVEVFGRGQAPHVDDAAV